MKSVYHSRMKRILLSPPSRGAWIEISGRAIGASIIGVAPLAGGVD